MTPDLSVVIPAFNEAKRLPPTLDRIQDYLRSELPSFEIVVVDDGSTDGTAEAIEGAGHDRLRLLRLDKNRGKGHAVRRGMLDARGALCLMTDADLSTPIEDLAVLLRALEKGYDVAIGSRAVVESRVEVRQPLYREAAGRLFNRMVRLLALPGLKDTQCGFKLWTREAARESFSLGRLDGFCFDVEALFIARKRGRRIAEVGVTWRNDAASRVAAAGGITAFFDILAIRWNDWAGRYRSGL